MTCNHAASLALIVLVGVVVRSDRSIGEVATRARRRQCARVGRLWRVVTTGPVPSDADDAPEFMRDCAMVVVTALAVSGLGCLSHLLEAAGVRWFGRSLAIVLLALLPILHYRLQVPARSSVARAIATSLVGLFFGVLLFVVAGFWLLGRLGVPLGL